MKGRSVYLGIDFGTTNSSIAYVVADPRDADAKKVEVKTVRVQIDDEGHATSDRVPTVVSAQFDEKGSKGALVGWDFVRQFRQPRKRAQLLRHGESFFRSVKSDLGSSRVYPHAFAPDFNTPEKVAAAVMRRLVQEAKNALPGYDLRQSRTVVTVPASLGALGREQTLEAACLSGLDRGLVELIDEPIAALLDFLNDGRAAGLLDTNEHKTLLIFDYGGGTLDLSLVRARFNMGNRAGLEVEHLAISQYRRLGGDDVDRAIMEMVVWPQIVEHSGIHRNDVPRNVQQMVEDTLTPTLARRLKESLCRQVARTSDGRFTSHKPEVAYEPIGRTFEGIELPRRVKMNSRELEKIMEPFLAVPEDYSDGSLNALPQSLLVPVLDVAREGGINPSELDAVILHGGSCRNPYVRRLLERAFVDSQSLFGNVRILETPELDASVARGAALAGYWRHERGFEIVAPITSEEIGIMTLNDMPVTLLESGRRVPFPDDSSVYTVPAEFYVPQDGARKMLVPFYTGRRRALAGSVTVVLPPGVKRGTPIQIKLRLERDKTLHWWYSIGGKEAIRAQSLQNPWTTEVPSPEVRRLQERQREMRETLLKTGAVPLWMEADEALLLHRAGRRDQAEVAAGDLEQRNGPHPWISNLRGLLCGAASDQGKALASFRKAAELGPNEPVLVGNYGYALADKGQLVEGEAKMRQALAMNPDLYYLHERLGDLYRQREDEESAKREYAEAIRIIARHLAKDSESVRLLNDSSRLYYKAGDYEKSREARGNAETVARNARLGGDDTLRIAGPDSGFLPMDDMTEEGDR